MTISDFTIFYLTLGSPAGVVAFLKIARQGWRPALTRALLIWFAWPLAVAYVASRPLKRRAIYDLLGEGANRSRNAGVRSARARDLNAIAAEALGSAGTFVFRDTVDRYIALAEAVESASSDHSDPPAADFFLSAGSHAPEIGTLCLARKNRGRLKKHLSKARVDLTDAVTRIPTTDKRLEARALLVLLFDSFADSEGRKSVADRLTADRDPLESPDMVGFKAA